MSCESVRFSVDDKVVHSPPPTAGGPTDTIHALRATFLPVAKTRPAKRSRREARR